MNFDEIEAENERLKERIVALEKALHQKPVLVGDMENMAGYELVHGQEGVGAAGKTGVKIFVCTDSNTKEMLARLKAEQESQSISRYPLHSAYAFECTIWGAVARECERVRYEQQLRLNPKTHERAADTKAAFAEAFEAAELGPIFMEPIPNEYWGNDSGGKFDPWFKVATPIGYIRIGWRKRVINIDWSATTLKALVPTHEFDTRDRVPSGKELFQFALDNNETTTVGDSYIHAYGYERVAAYLKVLAAHARQPGATRAWKAE